MDEIRARKRRNELTEFASRWWAGEAEVTRTFFSQPRSKDEHLRWLRMQAYKELQPRPNGIIIRLINELKNDYDMLEHGVDRHDFLPQDPIPGRGIPPLSALRGRGGLSHWREDDHRGACAIRSARRGSTPRAAHLLADQHGALARFASSFCEGGGASLYYEGMQVGGDELP